jgi:hypothetical protein
VDRVSARPARGPTTDGPGLGTTRYLEGRASCPRELYPKSGLPPSSLRLVPSAGKPLANTVSECEANDQDDCSFSIESPPIRELEVTIAHEPADVFFKTNVCCRSLSSVVKRAHAGGAAAPNSDVLARGPLNPRAPRSPFSPVARLGFFSSSSPLLLKEPCR